MGFRKDVRLEWQAVRCNFANLAEAKAYMKTRIPLLRARAECRASRIHAAASLFYPARTL